VILRSSKSIQLKWDQMMWRDVKYEKLKRTIWSSLACDLVFCLILVNFLRCDVSDRRSRSFHRGYSNSKWSNLIVHRGGIDQCALCVSGLNTRMALAGILNLLNNVQINLADDRDKRWQEKWRRWLRRQTWECYESAGRHVLRNSRDAAKPEHRSF